MSDAVALSGVTSDTDCCESLRPRQIRADDGRVATYGTDGRNAFAKFVTRADSAIRPRDEVLVEQTDGSLLAVGRAELPGEAILSFETGMAVEVSESVAESK